MINYDIYQFFVSILEAPKGLPKVFNYDRLYKNYETVKVITKFGHMLSPQIQNQLYAKYEHE